jgi:hypothetical protein
MAFAARQNAALIKRQLRPGAMRDGAISVLWLFCNINATKAPKSVRGRPSVLYAHITASS